VLVLFKEIRFIMFSLFYSII